MPTKDITIGPFMSLYAGDAAPASGPLIPITAERTKGSIQDYRVPQTFIDVLGTHVQSGRAVQSLDFHFLSLDDYVVRFAMGNSVEADPPWQPSQFAAYIMLFVAPDPDSEENVLVPFCETEKALTYERVKQSPTSVPVKFLTQNRNRFQLAPVMGTLDELLAMDVMTGRSPF